MTSNFLLLNSEKTEVLIIGPKNPTCNNLEHYLTLDDCSVNSSSSSVRNLGVLFDSNLSFESHVSSICKTTFFHLKNISKLWPMLSTSNAEMLIHAFMTSRLDYCNALLGGCSARLINKLQLVQNAAPRVPARSHGNSYIFYEVANSYEFVRPHSYKFIRFLLNRTYFTSCQIVWICTNDLHLTPPLNLTVTGV